MKMKNYLRAMVALVLAAGLFCGCTKDGSKPSAQAATSPKLGTNLSMTNSLAALPQSAFNLWTTCGTAPYYISGTNGICVPVGNCSSSVDAAQESNGQTASGFQFNGCFKGGTNASGYSEEAVFMCDNVTQWNGDEMGFVKTLNDNSLKVYVQGGGQYYTQVVLSNDNGYHTFKAQARSSNVHMVDFYIDGNYVCTLTNNSGHYYNNYDYFVGTNHWSGGSNPVGQQIEMYNMTTY
jgi:hypothetical protein